MAHTKSEWRRVLLAARSAIPEERRRADSAAISDRVRELACFAGVRTILGYVAVGAEADAGGLLSDAKDRRIVTLVPIPGCAMDRPRWVHVSGQLGDPARGRSALDLTYPILVLVPGVGFDHAGMRLGRGGGFYDRALADLRSVGQVHVVGLAFECQIVPVLPSDSWDQRVHVVVSEQRVLHATPDMNGGSAAIAS
jgi:5-formyltetrahydrofolate cyclo-ligase